MAGLVANELLCFVQNYYGKCTRAEIMNTLTGFYDDEECSNAKELLLAAVVESKAEGLSRPKARKDSANKKRLECEDMLSLFDFMDKKQVTLPVFCAVKLHRVPKISPSDVDVVTLAGTVESLKTQMSQLAGGLHALQDQLSQVASYVQQIAKQPHSVRDGTGTQQESSAVMSNGNQQADAVEVSNVVHFADLMKSSDEGEWFTEVKRKTSSGPVQKVKPPPTVRRVIGCGDGSKIKAVDKSNSWHVFVGRLEPSTTDSDVVDFLKDSGIDVSECKPLPKREPWQEKFAAFHVVVDLRFKDNIFDDVLWPKGVDVRDWVFSSSRHG